MSDRGRFSENRKLRSLFALADRIAGDVWVHETERGSSWIEVRRAAGGRCVVLDFTRDATRDDVEAVADVIDNLTFLLALVSRGVAKVREQEAEIGRLNALVEQLRGEIEALRETATGLPKDYAAQAAMMLEKPAFWLFLSEQRQGEVVEDAAAADEALKELLKIKSKSELNAAKRWLEMLAVHSAWERVLA